jgi:hypothetical protein
LEERYGGGGGGGVEEICVLGLLVEGGAIGGGVDWEGKGKG